MSLSLSVFFKYKNEKSINESKTIKHSKPNLKQYHFLWVNSVDFPDGSSLVNTPIYSFNSRE